MVVMETEKLITDGIGQSRLRARSLSRKPVTVSCIWDGFCGEKYSQDANWDPGAAAHMRPLAAEACPGCTGRFRAVEAEFANELSRSADALNTTAVIGYNATSGTWNVAQRYVYSPYGTLTILNANFTATPAGTVPLVNNLFQGMANDPVTGLYYERARWYSSSLGTWISQDPAQYPGAAAHMRPLAAEACPGRAGRFRVVDMTNNFGSTPNTLNINAPVLQDTYSAGVIQPNSRLYFTQDANWDTTAVVGYNASTSTWAVVQRYVYSPYGTLTILNANFTAAPTGTVPLVNNLFQGMANDPVTGLYYERARWYSPSLGRGFRRIPPVISTVQIRISL